MVAARTGLKRKVTPGPVMPRLTLPAGPLLRASAAPCRAPAPVPESPAPPPAGAGGRAESAEREVLAQVVTTTYWLDPGDSGMPYESVIRFTGRRVGIAGRPAPGDRFEQEETVRLVPGSGPVAVTTRADGVSAGDWLVGARLVGRHGHERGVDPGGLLHGTGLRRATRVLWPKGNPVPPSGSGTPARTRMAAFATAPGIITGSWAGFVAAGVAAALAALVVLLARVHAGAGSVLAVALAVSLAGAAGARGWYVMLQRGKVSGLPTRGLCIQGFIAGAALAGIPALLLAGIPAGTFFDAAAPGMFLAMAIGRQGCFFTGCCAGRPTASRWGIWSSDGRIGARRLPAQQLESLVCLLIGVAALAAFLRFGRSAGGTVFIGAIATYTLARQGLLALRAEPRRWTLARPVTLAAAATALLADILISAVR